MVRRSSTTYYPTLSGSRVKLRRATTLSLDENNINDLKRDIFKLSLYSKDTEPIDEIQETVTHISAENSSCEHDSNDVASRSPEIVENYNDISQNISINAPNIEDNNIIEQNIPDVPHITGESMSKEESSIEMKIGMNDQQDDESTFISDYTSEQNDGEDQISFNQEQTVMSIESTGIYPETSQNTTYTSNSYANIHKPLKELIYQTNRKLYDVDSRKVQYRAGLSKAAIGIPSLHPNKHKSDRPV